MKKTVADAIDEIKIAYGVPAFPKQEVEEAKLRNAYVTRSNSALKTKDKPIDAETLARMKGKD